MKRFKRLDLQDESKISISTPEKPPKRILKSSKSSSSGSSKTVFMVPMPPRYEKKLFCEKLKGKKICDNVEMHPPLKTDKMGKCYSRSKEPFMKVFREELCPKEEEETKKKTTTCSCSRSLCSCKKTTTWVGKSLSRNLDDTKHKASLTRPVIRLDGTSSEWKAPCPASKFDEREDWYIGKCTKAQKMRIPPKRPNWMTKFSLTENPRTTQCLRNPKKLEEPKNLEERYKEITEKVKLADNVDTPSISEESDTICIEMDLDNPIGLDFQGRDYKFTYAKDEQDIEDQKEYIIERRYIEKRKLKKQIANMIEEQLYNEKVTTPRFFDIMTDYNSTGDPYENDPIEIFQKDCTQFEEEPTNRLATLYRTQDKPINIAITEMEHDARFGRYNNLYLTKMEREQEHAAQKAEADQIAEENYIFDIAQKDFEDLIDERVVEIKAKFESLPKIERRKWYPHTLREAKHLRHKMKKSKRIIRDKAIIKKEFFKNQGYNKVQSEADLIIDEDTTSIESPSEQSTDDEDDISVGPKESGKYFLRGFHFKLGSEPRGKLHITQKREGGRALRTCQTRTEWFNSLVPDARAAPFYQYNPPNILKNQSPDDPKLQLFAPEKPAPITCDESPIKNFIEEEIGLQYKKFIHKTVKVKKPKYVKVKKFNLTGYLFGAKEGEKDTVSTITTIPEGEGFGQLNEYMRSKMKQKNKIKRRRRRQRMRYLGIPVNPIKQRKKETCVDVESEDSDWIPKLEHAKCMDKIDIAEASKMKMNRSGHARIMTAPILYVDNMPAPLFREPTLRRHPRRPRIEDTDFENGRYSKYYNLPRLVAPDDDKIIPYDLKERQTEYTHLFEARHHHDHIDPTQHKLIRVRYREKVPGVVTEQNQTGEITKKRTGKKFEKALPQGPDPGKFVDLSVPQIGYEEMHMGYEELIFEPEEIQQLKSDKGDSDISSNKEIFHSRQRGGGKEFPEYVKLIKDMAREIKKRLENVEDTEEHYVIDKEAYLKELEDELKSIHSCVTSLESSICTNFTNDSGSFLLVQDMKIPLDYVRKSLVPFEEIDRTRVKASLKHSNPEYFQPYDVVPFAGQKLEQRNLSKGKSDKFFTFNTRIRNGLRSRVEVESFNLKKTPIGINKVQALAQVATDLDENYMKDLEQSISMQNFKVKSSINLTKRALRQRFEIWYIKSQLVQQQIVEKQEADYAEDILKIQKLFNKLFTKWEKKEYDKSMAKVRMVKLHYEATAFLKNELARAEKNYTRLNMRIVFSEDDWIRRTILQNFHYLLMKNSWREEHDWIHQKEDGTLENYRESIEKRKTVNIRERDRDDAWAIKEFYENHYLKNKHPIVIVFPNADSFIKGIRKLKTRTFVCLLELHFILWLLINLEWTYRQYELWTQEFIETRTKFVKAKCTKKYFMEERTQKLRSIALNLLGKPLRDSISSINLRKIKSYGEVVYQHVIPDNIRQNVKQDLNILEKMGMVFDTVINLLGKLEHYPVDAVATIEKNYRKKLHYERHQSAQAYQVQKRILLTIEEIKRNMAPPYKKLKTFGKLPRLYLKKKPARVVSQEKRISGRTLFFYKAFVPEDDERSMHEDNEELLEMSNIQDTCIPFYFDYFLRMHNYEPNYNFKTKVELTYGPEEKPFRYKKVLNEVYEKMQTWEHYKKIKMEADIKKTLHLYTDIQI